MNQSLPLGFLYQPRHRPPPALRSRVRRWVATVGTDTPGLTAIRVVVSSVAIRGRTCYRRKVSVMVMVG